MDKIILGKEKADRDSMIHTNNTYIPSKIHQYDMIDALFSTLARAHRSSQCFSTAEN